MIFWKRPFSPHFLFWGKYELIEIFNMKISFIDQLTLLKILPGMIIWVELWKPEWGSKVKRDLCKKCSKIFAQFYLNIIKILYIYFYCQSCCCSVTQWCLTRCNPMDCSMPGFPVLSMIIWFKVRKVKNKILKDVCTLMFIVVLYIPYISILSIQNF